ncbi:MAG: hypothetical protein AAF349_10235 [Cyanobacteria bacterium P01_A01_bin.68]
MSKQKGSFYLTNGIKQGLQVLDKRKRIFRGVVADWEPEINPSQSI